MRLHGRPSESFLSICGCLEVSSSSGSTHTDTSSVGLWERRWQSPEWPVESFCLLTLWLWALVLRQFLPNLNISSRKQGLGEWAVYEPQEVNKLHTSRFSSENRTSMHTNLNSRRNSVIISSRNHSFSQCKIDLISSLSNDCTLITIFSIFVYNEIHFSCLLQFSI